MKAGEAREQFATARVARLATADADGRPHLVPICFALDGETIYTAVDQKPKRTIALHRLENIAVNARASALADRYDDDWSRLWWVRADGMARTIGIHAAEHRRAVALLADRYPQYRDDPPAGPAIALAVMRWTGWRYDHSAEPRSE
jgi:PPOX class probable F420-dependent enzyme